MNGSFLIHQLLENSALRHPQKPAVIYGDDSLTYQELAERSRSLANDLKRSGIKCGDAVGILLRKSLASIVSVYGILMSGAAYVPIDPMLPGNRIKYIIDNCNIRQLITSAEYWDRHRSILDEIASLDRVILTDKGPVVPSSKKTSSRFTDWKTVLGAPADSRTEPFPDTYPAYILHTSGSTGQPKGVVISHLNSLTFIQTAAEHFRISGTDRLACHAPLHFDLSVFDIFVSASAGATLVLIPESTSLFPVKLAEFIKANRITVWNSVSSALSLLADRGFQEGSSVPDMRLVIFSGEVMPQKYLKKLNSHMTGATFCNIYGQTEANSSTCYVVKEIPEDPKWKIPVGKALPNFEVFLIGEDGAEVTQPDREGEIFVNSSTVAQGYINMPELTKDRFVPDPRSPSFSRTVYKTGDIGYYDSEGNLVFLYRKDNMIKVRGHRVELGEIERTLSSHESVDLAVVTCVPDETLTNRIAAFVSWRSGVEGDVRRIKSFCEVHLPRYMLPEAIWPIEKWPRTANDKIDRKLLQNLAVKNLTPEINNPV
jgi:amino acid adenylation domain-containing protein